MPKPEHISPRQIMGRNTIVSNGITHRAYVKAGNWQCPNAPFNEQGKQAHFRRVDDAGNQTCVYCGDYRERQDGGIW